MEVIEKQIPHTRPDIFHIYALGDIHAGSINCAEDEIKTKVQEIKERKNAYWVGMGDYADCITEKDYRFEIKGLAPWVSPDNIVESQRAFLKKLFQPIAPKCLAFLTGNHEELIHREHSNDITRNLCGDLNLPYGGYHSFLVLHFARGNTGSRREYKLHLWHGAGSAQTEGARLMRLVRLVNDIEASIYLMGHLHAMTNYTPDRLKCEKGKVKSTQLIAQMTGSWLKAYMQPEKGQTLNPTYIEKKGYKPSRIGCPIIHINPDKDNISVES